MKRYEFLRALAGDLDEAAVLAAGGTFREWYSLRPEGLNFRGKTLGLLPSIGLGIALSLPRRPVVVFDGDGAVLMNLCALPTIAWKAPPNLIHVVFDNGVYEASGGTTTAAAAKSDLVALARGAGISQARWVKGPGELRTLVREALGGGGPWFLAVKVEAGRTSVPEVERDELELKYGFIRRIEALEGIKIISVK